MDICFGLACVPDCRLSLVSTPSGSRLFHFLIKSVEFLFEKMLFFRLWIIPLEGDSPLCALNRCCEFSDDASIERFKALFGDFECVFHDCVCARFSLHRDLVRLRAHLFSARVAKF